MRLTPLRLALAVLLAASPLARPMPLGAAPAPAGGETVEQALCRLITTSAEAHHIPAAFLTRLIWQESAFRPGATSPAGAQGIAQFMPGTAAERGLDDPFDPEQAVPASASLLGDLAEQFGNLGLAAAAYNAGARRVADWLAGRGGLPFETRDYVERITGRDAEDWAADVKNHQPHDVAAGPETCLQLASTLRTAPRLVGAAAVVEAPFAPWGVQLAGNFSKSLALASFARARASLAGIIGDLRPMVIGTRLRTRGTRAFYRIRVPAASRQEADALCRRIQAARGACVTLRS
jgi:hypothetical protein